MTYTLWVTFGPFGASSVQAVENKNNRPRIAATAPIMTNTFPFLLAIFT